MATWDDLDGVMGTSGAKRLGTTGWAWSIPLDGDNEQTVFVFREPIAPDLELVRAMSVFAHTSEADVAAVVREHGQLSAGSIAYTPAPDADARGGGNLALSTVMPLAVLDLSTPHQFLLHLAILARAAQDIGQRLAAANQLTPAAPAVAPARARRRAVGR